MPITPPKPIAPEPEATRYAYQDAQGRYWAGHPGPGATIDAATYAALPAYVKQVFQPVETSAGPTALEEDADHGTDTTA